RTWPIAHPSIQARRPHHQSLGSNTARFEVGFDPARSNSASAEEMTPPAGFFVITWLDGGPVGCGALKVAEGGTGEIKRMWTAPNARGLGIARRALRSAHSLFASDRGRNHAGPAAGPAVLAKPACDA
ncbi:MAG: GNAT family N-acetyltransferase, partial [Pseudomonadota bacterium]|nr:GNAT family N-acetyltransferase [Pseudomonadota bacterium]